MGYSLPPPLGFPVVLGAFGGGVLPDFDTLSPFYIFWYFLPIFAVYKKRKDNVLKGLLMILLS